MTERIEVDAEYLNHIKWLLKRLPIYIADSFLIGKINEIKDQLDCIIRGDVDSKKTHIGNGADDKK